MPRKKTRIPGQPCRCPKCGEYKPLTSEFWCEWGGKFDGHCKTCKAAKERMRRAGTLDPLFTRGRREPIPCTVVVAENANGERRALYYDEWDRVPDGWHVVGTGTGLLIETWDND